MCENICAYKLRKRTYIKCPLFVSTFRPTLLLSKAGFPSVASLRHSFRAVAENGMRRVNIISMQYEARNFLTRYKRNMRSYFHRRKSLKR